MQDVGYWEKHGVQSVAVTTSAFLRQASQQLHDLGLNGVCYATVPHPVQGLPSSELGARLDKVLPDLLRALQDDAYESPSPAPSLEAQAGAARVDAAECGS